MQYCHALSSELASQQLPGAAALSASWREVRSVRVGECQNLSLDDPCLVKLCKVVPLVEDQDEVCAKVVAQPIAAGEDAA